MPEPDPTFRNILVIAHPQVAEAAAEAAQVAAFLEQHGAHAESSLLYDEEARQRLAAGEFDLLIALGGDGTMLRAGHLCAPNRIPILGINMGRFGFLTEIKQGQWRNVLPRLFGGQGQHSSIEYTDEKQRYGDFWLEQRMMLRAELWRAETLLGSWDVLNEIVVTRGLIIRPLHLNASVDGRFLATYVADALIAATATGSTAYALAAGGPILPPELRNILLVAVAPHLSIDRAIVLAEGSSVSITVNADHPAVLSPDGQPAVEMAEGDRVDARASNHTVQFLRLQDPGYFYRNLTPHMNQNPSTGNSR